MNTTVEARSADAWEQALRLAFLLLMAVVGTLALVWATGNMRQVPAESRAVILRFGAFTREQSSGLLLAWPSPFEHVVVLPAADRQLALAVTRLNPPPGGLTPDANPRDTGGFLLTGDNGVVNLRATLLYSITDPAAYLVARDHIPPALERLFIAAAVTVMAARELDTVIVTRAGTQSGTEQGKPQGARERLCTDLMRATNARLDTLAEQGAALGIQVRRVDVAAALPAETKSAYDEVLRTGQAVETAIQGARTEAANGALAARQQRDAILAEATAAAAERIAAARNRTAVITALSAQTGSPAAIEQTYADRVGRLLSHAARVDVLDPHDSARVILPGSKP